MEKIIERLKQGKEEWKQVWKQRAYENGKDDGLLFAKELNYDVLVYILNLLFENFPKQTGINRGDLPRYDDVIDDPYKEAYDEWRRGWFEAIKDLCKQKQVEDKI